ncbi:hypothetical protein ACH4ND_29525 [Streptomyces sp. NPDC017179]|uniref:hypothetical protein n=1 Tax=Streptomyces sp. NPDC017179 TaxID=3364979 RepID=UPI0037BC3C60
MTLELGGGVLGTLLGGRLADRIGMVRTVQIGNAAMVPPAEGATATDTAHACGWASTSAFVGVFAQAMGTTPGTYRAGVLNQQEDGHVAGRAGVLSAP